MSNSTMTTADRTAAALQGRANKAFWRSADPVDVSAKRAVGWARAFAKKMGRDETVARAREALDALPADLREMRDICDHARWHAVLGAMGADA